MRISKRHKPAQAYQRKIHLSDGVWTWRQVNRYIWIRPPDNTQTFQTTVKELTGVQIYYDYEFEKWMPVSGDELHITPAKIKKFIEENVKASTK